MPRARQAGFTLIEVLVALAILSIAVVASIQGFAQGLRLLKLAGDHQQAMLLADEKVREVVEFKEGNDSGTEGLLRWERSLKSLEAPDLIPATGVPRAKVYQIDVRVNWEPQRHVEIHTIRTVPTETVQAALPGGAATAPPVPGTTAGGTPFMSPPTTPGSSGSMSQRTILPGGKRP